MTTRRASHAGSWYSSNKRDLSNELDGYLAAVPAKADFIGTESSKSEAADIPTPHARAIIAPHAGFSYSGPAAAWAYKAVDWSNVKRIFLLGPSHHYYLSGCALSRCSTYATPLGNLRLDTSTITALSATNKFTYMTRSADEDEHSLEMHLPYIYKMLSLHHADEADFPPLVPILVGSTDRATEKAFGALLAPYLADPATLFIASSDFCHWGSRFRYTYYQPSSGEAVDLRADARIKAGERPIHESIRAVDWMCMDAVETGRHEAFLDVLEETGNTVCGRHPIGVVMAAVEVLEGEGRVDGKAGQGRFKFVRYERSSLVSDVGDSSVSYCSAFAVL